MFSKFRPEPAAIALVAMAALILGACTVPATVASEPVPPEVTADGLELIEKTRHGEIYADRDVDWNTYDRILLDPATVSFRKNWQRDLERQQPLRVRPEDIERIKTGLAELFNDVFTEELSKNGGYEIASAPGEDVLRITPRIVDLDAYAPDLSGAGRVDQYSESAGRMTLKLELYDSVTGDLIATASDRQEDPRLGWMEWRTRASNRADAERMLERWAGTLRERLDAARRQDAAQG
jgi:hypothetical protein